MHSDASSMRVLLAERALDGHRKTYMEWLSKMDGVEMFVLAPQNVGVEESHFFRFAVFLIRLPHQLTVPDIHQAVLEH